ncbi:MAG: hypothetical protein BV457_00190 [Thermoplasmata archaeon M9B1D]|nr:MAG: hypothetical protein BV457_00190 [Thermoplasmata archaeon M9B1D]PNX52216.1 MAG: hypothetical protein BV456_00105 [Thermoplasmata archaeon M8B2D]
MADGKVRIIIVTNAESVASQFRKLDDSINKTGKSAKKLNSTAKILKNSLKTLGIAFGVRQIITFGKELINTSLELEALDNKLLASAGSAELAGQSYQFISDEAQRLGIDLRSAIDGFAGFSASALRSGLTFEETKEIFSDVSDALVSLNLSATETSFVFRALQQVAGKGKVSLEEISGQLGDTLPGAVQLAIDSLGKSREEFFKLIKTGEIVSKDFLPTFAEEIRKSLGINVEEASQSARANFNRLNNSILLLKDSLGQQLVPELESMAISIRDFVDNEGDDLVKTFKIIIDSIKVFTISLKVLQRATTFNFNYLIKDIGNLKKALDEFGDVKTADDLRNIGDAGKYANDNIEIQESTILTYDKLKEQTEKIKEQLRDLAITGQQGTETFKNLRKELKANEEQLKLAESATKFQEALISIDDVANIIGNDLANALTTPFEQGETAGERFKKVIIGILQEIARQLIATGIARSIANIFGGGATGIASTPSAKGNVFKDNKVMPFANGGVVSSPTLFPMQKGIGLMGEAGAEAILPLTRTKNGKLGVETSGGGNINIFNQTPSQIEVIKRPNNDRDIFIKQFNSALSSERSKSAFETALQNQDLRGVQAS